MQLREAEALGVLDHHDVGVGHVDADFDDRRRDEDLDRAFREGGHRLVFFLGRKRAMQKADALAENLPEMGEAFFRRGKIGQLRTFDQRADPIDLRALGELRANAFDETFERFQR